MQAQKLASDLTVHTYASGEGGIFVNAFLVETPSALVAVDTTLTESTSKELRGHIDALGKPLEAVLITHGHPDHVAGTANVVRGLSPRIIATEQCVALMQRTEEAKRRQWTPVFGAEWVQRWTYPDTTAKTGARFDIGGATFSLLDIGPGGDADTNAVWFLEAPARTAFLGDVVFNAHHSYVADGHVLAWLANLTLLGEACRGMDVVFPGHGAPDRPERLFSEQRDYLLALIAHVKELAGGASSLSDGAKQELERRMKARIPSAGLSFLIALSADAIARELNG